MIELIKRAKGYRDRRAPLEKILENLFSTF